MSLSAILEETTRELMKQFSPEMAATAHKALAELDERGIGDNAMKAGDTFPDATLTDAMGNRISISSLLVKGPLIVSFYRGGWCPYCNLELKAYQDRLDDIHDIGGQLVAISPEKPDGSLSATQKNALTFPVLTDDGNALASALGITFELPTELQKPYAELGVNLPEINAKSGWALPIPASFVVASSGEIKLAHVERDYKIRLEPSDAVDALRTCLVTT